MAAFFHQTLFVLIALVGIAELSLTAFLFSKGKEAHHFPSRKYHDLLIFFLVNASWTILFAMAYAYWIINQSMHFLASVAASIWWLFITSALWGVATGMFHTTRTGNICDGSPSVSPCRESLTVEALGWTVFALCLFTVLATWHWVINDDGKGSLRASWYSDQAREPARRA